MKTMLVLIGLIFFAGLALAQVFIGEPEGKQADYESSVAQKIAGFELRVDETFSKDFEINGEMKKVSLTFKEIDSPKNCRVFVADESGNWVCGNFSTAEVRLLVETSSGSGGSTNKEGIFRVPEADIVFDEDYSIYLGGLKESVLVGGLYDTGESSLLRKIVPVTFFYGISEDTGGIVYGLAVPDSGGGREENREASEEPRSESSEAVLKVGESFFDTYKIDGDLKTIKTTYKDFQVSEECISKPGFEPTGCGEYHKIVLLVEIKSGNSGEVEAMEAILDEYSGGKNIEEFLSENYSITRGRVYEDGAVEFHFYKKILPENGKVLNSQAGQPDLGEIVMRQNEIEVKSKLAVEVSGQNLLVKTSTDKKTLNVSPAKAVEVVKTQEKTDCEELSLLEKNSKVVYECKTKQSGKVFGLIPVEFEVTAQVDGENGEVSSIKPFWSFLVFT